MTPTERWGSLFGICNASATYSIFASLQILVDRLICVGTHLMSRQSYIFSGSYFNWTLCNIR